MKFQKLQYTTTNGWSIKNFPDLDSENTLIIIFASPNFKNNPQPLKDLAKTYPKSSIIGCSTAGEISGSEILDDSLSIVIIKFEKTYFKTIKTSLKNTNSSLDVGKHITNLLKSEDLSAIFVLSDGLKINGSQLVLGLNENIANDVIITGGLAGDGKNFKETWVIFNDEILSNTVVAVGFYGKNIQVGHATRGGWDIFGPERIVTRSTANILYELDGIPALSLYKEYLGERSSELPSSGLLFPLAIRENNEDKEQIVRTILAVDEKKQSLIFAGDIPEGYLAQLMRANFDRLITSAGEAGSIAIDNIMKNSKKVNGPILSIAISCVGRRLLMGERTEEEIEALLESLPESTEQFGFYSYGEISPYTSGKCDLHNQTMTLTLLYEN